MNLEKASEDCFGFTKDYDVECWEFKNNTSDACNFWSEIPSNWDEDFEARYPDKHKDISRFKTMHDWVVSTNQNKATNADLSSAYTDIDGNTHTKDTAAYRLAKFKTEFENWFDMHFALIYYTYTFFALMVDQRAKNMFITYWGKTNKFYHYFYDNDTSFGIDNEGSLIFDYYFEDSDQLNSANVYNGQNSTFWVNFRQSFPDKIKETYQNLRSNSVLNYEELEDQFITKGSDKWSESVYNEDGDFKYVSMLRSDDDATNLPQVRGTGEEHFRYFIENRLNYCDSKWYAGEYPNDYAVVRIYTPTDENGNPRTDLSIPASANITVTPYSHMYAGVRYKANGTLYQERLEANETYTFEAPNEVFNDTETAIYGASQLSSLGDLAPLYLGYIDVGNATKLVELKVGDGTPGYQNGNLYHLAVGTNRLLKKIDIQNCIGFNQALVLSGCPNIEEVYAKGSGITGVDLPASGYLKKLQLPGTIANLTLKNQPYVTDFSLEGYTNLKTVQIENCPTINSLDLLDKAINVERVRLTNVDWNYSDASVLYELIDRDISGIDENGTNIDTMWIDGKCHIDTLTGNEYAEIKRLYPYLEITYNNLTSQLVFMTDDGETELYRQTIINGANGIDPVESGAIETPTKESTAQYHFEYMGWSLTPGGNVDRNALLKVEMDRYVYAAYYKDLRSYDVNFYNDTVLLQTQNVKYGTDATYVGSTPQKILANEWETPSDFEFIGWIPEPTNIQGTTNCYAQYRDKREITDKWDAIATACLNGQESKYKIGAFKQVYLGADYLPYNFNNSNSTVVYNNEIHILGSNDSSNYKKHYAWNGKIWYEASTLPYNFYQGNVVVWNDEIHILGGTVGKTNHYKWDGFEWNSVSTLPYDFYQGVCVVYNDEIHILGSNSSQYDKNHYKWDGTDWTEVSTIPVNCTQSCSIVFNNKIHISGTSSTNHHYSWNGTEWTTEVMPPSTSTYAQAVVYEDKVHVFSGYNSRRYHRIFDGTTWTSLKDLSLDYRSFGAVVYNNEIYLLGGDNNPTSFNKYDGEIFEPVNHTEKVAMEVIAHNHDELSKPTWKRVYVGNTAFGGRTVTVSYNGKIHHINGTVHKTYDGTTIETLATLPFTAVGGCCKGIVWNNEIHIVGADGNASPTIQYHYKYDGTEWTSVCEPSYSGYTNHRNAAGYGSTLAIYNNEMYRTVGTGDNKNLYKFDGTSWVEVTTLPRSVYQGVLASCKDGLHILVGTDHYKWDGTECTRVSTLPYDFSNGSAIEFLDELHLFGGLKNKKAHHKWNGNNWVRLDDMIDNHGYVGTTTALIHNNELYLSGSGPDNFPFAVKWCIPKWNVLTPHTGIPPQNVIIYNDEIWIQTRGALSNRGDGSAGTGYSYVNKPLTYATECFVFQNEIHMIGSEAARTNPIHYKYDFTHNDWVIASNIAEVTAYGPHYANCCVYKDTLYYFNLYNKYYYTFNGTSWSEQYELPVSPESNTNLIVYNDKIHIFLGRNFNQHYTFDGSNWKFVCETPFSMKSMPLVVINNKLYALYYSDGFITYYEFNGSEWFNTKYKILSPYKGLTNSNTIVYHNKIYAVGVNNTDPSYEHYNRLNIARLENPKAGLTFLAKNLLKDYRAYNSTHGSYWSVSELRDFCNNELYDAMPEDLRSSIKEVEKISDTGTIGKSLEGVTDMIWVPSVEELGVTDSNTSYTLGQGYAYTVFTDNNSRKYATTSNPSQFHRYWTRTAYNNWAPYAVYITTEGKALGGNVSDSSTGVLPGFCI